jgi:hypothetical protein
VVCPQDWSICSTTSPAGWDGVTGYGTAPGGHPGPRPDGPNSQCYGDFAFDFETGSAQIGQTISSGGPSGTPVEMWVGAWVYSADNPAAFVKLSLSQAATAWDSGPMNQILGACGGNPCWTWHEFSVPVEAGFTNDDVDVLVDVELDFGAGLGVHGMYVDGVELEILEVPPATATGWRSIRTHGDLGELGIPLDPAATGNAETGPTVETRLGGVQKLEVGFDGVPTLTGTIEAEELTNAGLFPADSQTVVDHGDGTSTLVIEFIAGLPDQGCYVIDLAGRVQDLAGDTDCHVRVLTGDANGTGLVELADFALVKMRIQNQEPVLPDNVKYDISADGRILLNDVALVKLRNGNTALCSP